MHCCRHLYSFVPMIKQWAISRNGLCSLLYLFGTFFSFYLNFLQSEHSGFIGWGGRLLLQPVITVREKVPLFYRKMISNVFRRLALELEVENLGMRKRLNRQYVFYFYLKKGICIFCFDVLESTFSSLELLFSIHCKKKGCSLQ